MKTDYFKSGFWGGLVFLIMLSSCIEQNSFPETPEISLDEVKFIDVPDQSSPDTLVLSINFQDGDGDLGLDNLNEIFYPYNSKYYFIWLEPIKQAVKFTNYFTQSGSIVRANLHAFFKTEADRDAFISNYLSNTQVVAKSIPGENYVISFTLSSTRYTEVFFDNLILLDSKETIAELDTLPDFVRPYNCTNYENIQDIGTVYYQHNTFHNNIIVKFFVEENGFYQEFNWQDIYSFPQCNTSFDGRFPIMNKTDRQKPLEGNIKYNMASFGFNPLFGNNRMKLQIQIFDRALNQSNIIETPPFRLPDIK